MNRRQLLLGAGALAVSSVFGPRVDGGIAPAPGIIVDGVGYPNLWTAQDALGHVLVGRRIVAEQPLVVERGGFMGCRITVTSDAPAICIMRGASVCSYCIIDARPPLCGRPGPNPGSGLVYDWLR